jgi:hypothetical protein
MRSESNESLPNRIAINKQKNPVAGHASLWGENLGVLIALRSVGNEETKIQV